MGWNFLTGWRVVADPCEFLTNLRHFAIPLLLLFILLLILFLFLLFFLKHYSPFRTLASDAIFLYFRRSLTNACLFFFLFPFYWNPLLRSTIFYLVFLFFLFFPLHLLQFVLTLVDFALFQHLSQSDFINFTVYSPRHMSLVPYGFIGSLYYLNEKRFSPHL